MKVEDRLISIGKLWKDKKHIQIQQTLQDIENRCKYHYRLTIDSVSSVDFSILD